MKLNRLLLLSLLLVLVNCSLSYSQAYYLYGDKTYGGDKGEGDGTI